MLTTNIVRWFPTRLNENRFNASFQHVTVQQFIRNILKVIDDLANQHQALADKVYISQSNQNQCHVCLVRKQLQMQSQLQNAQQNQHNSTGVIQGNMPYLEEIVDEEEQSDQNFARIFPQYFKDNQGLESQPNAFVQNGQMMSFKTEEFIAGIVEQLTFTKPFTYDEEGSPPPSADNSPAIDRLKKDDSAQKSSPPGAADKQKAIARKFNALRLNSQNFKFPPFQQEKDSSPPGAADDQEEKNMTLDPPVDNSFMMFRDFYANPFK